MDELKSYTNLLLSKIAYAEELYGIKINYVPLIVRKEETIIFDKRDGKIKNLSEKRELSREELEKFKEEIIQNIKNGTVELYLTLTFGEDVGL
ncbi:hypothetical protein PAP_00995 [Palaeococcus pacificus DY20341]|uniref:Uncharacterized protein n=1 Tax=Palaeococcus pacificus DY20341 TaxID=1343739 RepID=A0A075LRC8_9EURY|nr:hypothetical protein [Palaeococcus pacificus]AIF68641.1 hypothetical protein PAP_00995 [Palaeococcus pacificus DY20341]